VPLYRYKVLTGDVALRVWKLVRQSCEAFKVRILKEVVSQDHVHILVSAPPDLGPSEIMRRVKGRSRSAAKLFEEFRLLKKRYWGRHFWARGYLVLLCDGGSGDGGDDQELADLLHLARPGAGRRD